MKTKPKIFLLLYVMLLIAVVMSVSVLAVSCDESSNNNKMLNKIVGVWGTNTYYFANGIRYSLIVELEIKSNNTFFIKYKHYPYGYTGLQEWECHSGNVSISENKIMAWFVWQYKENNSQPLLIGYYGDQVMALTKKN